MKGTREAKIQFDLAYQLKNVIEKYEEIEGINFNENVEPEYPINSKRADIVVFEDSKPFIVIETKRKIERAGKINFSYDFDPNSEKVIHQAFTYAGLIGAKYFATTNGSEILVFRYKSPFNRLEALVYHESIEAINEVFAFRLLSELSKKSRLSLEEAKLPIDWNLIIRFRGFVNYLYPKVKEELFKKINEDERFKRKVDNFIKNQGLHTKETEEEYDKYREFIAKESVYLLLNKIIFYKILEKQRGNEIEIPKLKRDRFKDISSVNGFFSLLRGGFLNNEEVLKKIDFIPIFKWTIFDEIPYPEDIFVLEYLIDFIDEIGKYNLSEIKSDVIGHVYEELIPDEERHNLGQYYTPPSIAELIVNWCVRNPEDKILDPGCGSGTFLVKSYNKLLELKGENNQEIHEKIISQLYGIDISPFPAHLTTINLAIKNIESKTNVVNIIPDDFFNTFPGQKKLSPYKVETPRGVIEGIQLPSVVDCVVANPPYTRHEEIGTDVKGNIFRNKKRLKGLISKYKISGESGIYIYFILHGFLFLKDNGRLGMIIPEVWMYSDYGKNFKEFLLDNFKISGIVLSDRRVFKMPLISTCILLLEKVKEGREKNKTTLIYVSGEIEIERVLDLINNNITIEEEDLKSLNIEQKQLEAKDNWSDYLFLPKIYFELRDKLINLGDLEKEDLIKIYSTFAVQTGVKPFFLLNEKTVKSYNLDKFVIPAISKAQDIPIYDFDEEDWKRLKDADKTVFLFFCRLPREKVLKKKNVIGYIKFGEGKGFDKGVWSKAKKKSKRYFDWYDVGELGVSSKNIIFPRHAHNEIRFVYAPFKVRPAHNVMLISINEDRTDEDRIFALLSYLNSNLTGFFGEILSRSMGGGQFYWDLKPLRNLPIIDINSLSQSQIEKLSESFDKFRKEVRKQYGRWKDKKAITRNEFKSKVEELRKELLDKNIAEILNLSENDLNEIYGTLEFLRKRRLKRLEKADYMIKGEEPTENLTPFDFKKKKGKKEKGKQVSLYRVIE